MPRMAVPAIRRFWNEIRRRHVVRIAAYYVAGAWIVAQAASLLFDAFDAQHYTRYVIALLGLGLPVALVLAWIFDVTPRGIERTVASTRASDAASDPTPGIAVPPPPERSIAVLPLANLSDDPANEYFSDGLSEEIRNQLARMDGLRVAARSSSFAFKGRHEDVREIGRRLGVATVLEGGVRRQAGTVRIDLQLVNTADGYQIWSESFERRLDDIFRLQSEIACAVTSVVDHRHREPERPAARSDTGDFAAYNAYLLGRHHFHKRTAAALTRAVDYFRQAIEVDPGYALAYSGLSDAYVLLAARHYGNLSDLEAIDLAGPATQRAMELEPELAEAHASLGLIELQRGRFAEAEAAFRQALSLSPGYTTALVWLGLSMNAQGRYREAFESNQDALRVDPLSPIVNSNYALDALRFGDFDGARQRFATALEIDPDFLVPYSGMARVHVAQGQLAQALEWIERALARAPDRAFFHARKGLLLLQIGRPEEAAVSIAKAVQMAPGDVVQSELAVALAVARDDRVALAGIVRGDAGQPFGPWQQAQAAIALGDLRSARLLYDREPPEPGTEIHDVLGGDWIWRLPHALNFGHLLLDDGDDRGGRLLEDFVARAERAHADGIVSTDLMYRAATARALLGPGANAAGLLEEAARIGWRDGWWARVDWNAAGLLRDDRARSLLEDASG
jgi:TolB-like protein/Tfp pilus assembly protein PilF